MTTRLELIGISAAYGKSRVLTNISLDIVAGEFVALLGPSGCGKTTLLKVIAGLLNPTAGEIRFNNASVTALPAEKRQIGMVFQKPLLFPYLNVFDNVAFGLKMSGVSRQEIKERVGEALRSMQLEGFEHRYARELSGGQEQRVALARAIVTRPAILLLDEPFSSLDENLRKEMRFLIRKLQKELQITTVFVTHDQYEAATLADRLGIILAGRLEQFGKPGDLYRSPLTPAVARFFGWKVLDGELVNGSFITSWGNLKICQKDYKGEKSVAFHPDNVKIINSNKHGLENCFVGTIQNIMDIGTRIRYLISIPPNNYLEIEQPAVDNNSHNRPSAIGDRVLIQVPVESLRLL